MNGAKKSVFFKNTITTISLLTISKLALAVNPVPSWYGGIMLGVSGTQSVNINNSFESALPRTIATLKYNPGGNIAGQAGYRFPHFRVEGELLFNYSPYSEIETPSGIIKKQKKSNIIPSTPISNTTPSAISTLTMDGKTNTGAFLVNGFYDFYSTDDSFNWTAYVGLGIGYATVSNNLKLYQSNAEIVDDRWSKSATTPAAQGIVGIGYFVDDFTSIGLDFRYLATKSIEPFNSRNEIASLNVTLNGSFDCG
jgi:opacity protein-like surface antigen